MKPFRKVIMKYRSMDRPHQKPLNSLYDRRSKSVHKATVKHPIQLTPRKKIQINTGKKSKPDHLIERDSQFFRQTSPVNNSIISDFLSDLFRRIRSVVFFFLFEFFFSRPKTELGRRLIKKQFVGESKTHLGRLCPIFIDACASWTRCRCGV